MKVKLHLSHQRGTNFVEIIQNALSILQMCVPKRQYNEIEVETGEASSEDDVLKVTYDPELELDPKRFESLMGGKSGVYPRLTVQCEEMKKMK